MRVRLPHWIRRPVIFLAGACAALANAVASAQGTPPAKLLPENPFVYITLDGMAGHSEAWKKTAAYESWTTSGLKPAVEKLLKNAVEALPPAEGERLRKVAARLMHSGFSLTIAGPEDAAVPLPYFILVLHDGAELEADITTTAQMVAAQNKTLKVEQTQRESRRMTLLTSKELTSAAVEIGWWVEKQHLVFAAGFGAIQLATNVADGDQKNITEMPAWKKYQSTQAVARFEQISLSWVDVGALLKSYGTFPFPNSPHPQRPLNGKVIAQALGFNTIGRIVSQEGFSGRAVWTVSTLEAAQPRKGVSGMFDGPPMTLADLPPLPREISAAYATSLHWQDLYKHAVGIGRNVAKLDSPQTVENFEGTFKALPQLLNFDPDKDLFGALGPVTCLYNDALNGFLGIGPVLAIQARKADVLEKTLQELLSLTKAEGAEVDVQQVTRNGHVFRHIRFLRSGFGLAVAIEPDWLVISLTPQAVEAFTMRKEKRLPRWEPDEQVQAALQELPKSFNSLRLTDSQKVLAAVVSAIPNVLAVLEIAMKEQHALPRDFVMPISAADFPPGELIAKPLFPKLCIGRSDAQGFQWITRSPGF